MKEPEALLLGQKHVKCRRGSKMKSMLKNDEAYYVACAQTSIRND